MRMMRQPWYVRPSVLLAAISAMLIASVLLLCIDPRWLDARREALSILSNAVTVFGVILLVPAVLGYLAESHARRFELQRQSVHLAINLLSKFYDSRVLDKIRRDVRNGTEYEIPGEGISDDEVQMMNYFEAVAMAVERGLIDVHLLDRMLGYPIWEITQHKTTRRLLKDKFGYEGFTTILVRALKPLWDKREHVPYERKEKRVGSL